MTAYPLSTLRLLAAILSISTCTLALAQVEDPAALSTTPAESALSQHPAAGDGHYPGHTAQPLRFRPASERTDIGRATQQLFSAQREAAAQQPRFIDGEQASRSYARYLKSFETDIPEFYETGIDTGIGN